MKLRTALGEILREERQAQHKTLRSIAATGAIAMGYLSEIERGHKEVSSEVLEYVALALGLEAHELVMRASLRMAGVDIPDTPKSLFDEYADLVVR